MSFSLSKGLLGFLDVFESLNEQNKVSQLVSELCMVIPCCRLTVGVFLRHGEELIFGVMISILIIKLAMSIEDTGRNLFV